MRRTAWTGLLFLAAAAALAQSSSVTHLTRIESAFADMNDAVGAIGLIDSGYASSHGGLERAAWERRLTEHRGELRTGLARLPSDTLSVQDARAVALMRTIVEPTDTSAGLAPVARCSEAKQAGLGYTALSEALYACFDELGNNIEFEGGQLTRVAALDALAQMADPERRKALFLAFTPLWQAINGEDEPASPFRRLIGLAAVEAREKGSGIDAAARTLGVAPAEVELWLTGILDTWRRLSGDAPIEPWDYRYVGGAAERLLGGSISLESLGPLSARYYADLGADLKAMGVIYDLGPRAGKAPLAYADFVSRGRYAAGQWQPTVVRVSANYARGGLGVLNELVHEDGHVIHMMAVRTRPAFMDLGDSLFVEAFADVTSWNTYDPAWQRKYLGRSAPEAQALRSLYSGVMLDVAWALFELRMLRDPAADPNAVWTAITSRYLHIVPHPELAWWAVRVQLVGSPGYMVNYGLGAVLTADLRERIRQQLGPFETGDLRWYGWISERLLRSGQERETAELLQEFLGRPVSSDALIADIRRMEKDGK